jgi:hypothetical protein
MNRSNIEIYSKLPRAESERLLALYESRQDSVNAAEAREGMRLRASTHPTEGAADGELVEHRHYDERTGRIWYTYTGSPSKWMDAYTAPGATCRLNRSIYSGANGAEAKARAAQTVTTLVPPGMKVSIVKA